MDDAEQIQQLSFDQRLRRERHFALIERLRAIFSVGGALFASFWLFDISLPEVPRDQSLAIRLGGLVVGWGSFLAIRTAIGQRLLIPMGVLMSLYTTWSLAYLGTFLSVNNPYYALGTVVVIFAIAFLAPWRAITMALVSVAITVGYLLISVALTRTFGEMIISTSQIGTTCILGILASAIGERQMSRDLRLRIELEQANERLKSLDAAKTRFFSNVSHELRTPLMLILGPLDALLETAPIEQKPFLMTMAANGRRLLRQINLLLDFSKLEVGRLTPAFTTGNLGKILGELVSSTHEFAESRGVKVTAEGLDSISDSRFDVTQIETVAANLLSNALKFTPSGGRIVLRAREDKNNLFFEVEDSGVGIREEQLDRVFERFHQVDGGLTRRREGSGLGLSMVKELVSLHQGEVSVQSTFGKGTTFSVRLPRIDEVASTGEAKPSDAAAAGRPEAADSAPLRTLLADVRLDGELKAAHRVEAPQDAPRVLVAEDNPELLDFLSLRLGRTYRVEAKPDGQQALEAARKDPPDIIVSDVMMPVMDGYELCRQLRDDTNLRTIPVILLTARADSDAVVRGLELGAVDYVTKPFELQELEARIAAQLRSRELERSLHERESRLAAIGRMASAIVHDLKNPLTIVNWNVEIGRSTVEVLEGAEEVLDTFTEIEAATARLLGMIQEVLDYSYTAVAEPAPKNVDVAEFLREMSRELNVVLGSQGITLRCNVPESGETQARVDPKFLRRVIENLVGNAREALQSVRGEGRDLWVELALLQTDEGICLRVADNGPGIAEEVRANLFEPYSTYGKSKGTGLGLATVRNLVKAQGGEVSIDFTPAGASTAFMIGLPRPVNEDSQKSSAILD